MASFNQAIIIGNVGKDPDVRNVGDRKVAQFSVATAAGKDATDWHNVVVWSPFADFVEQHVRKGMQVQVCGRISYRSYKGNDGATRYITEIVSNQPVLLLGSKGENGAQSGASTAKAGNDSDMPVF